VNRSATLVRPAKRRRRHDPPVSHERWLVSYADFITLLFAFFTTMYAISTVDARKLSAVVDSMHAAFANGDVPAPARKGGGPGGGGTQLAPGPEVIAPAKPQVVQTGVQPVTLSDLQARLGEQLSEQIRDGTVEVLRDPRGLLISLREAGAFPTGSADLSLTAQAVLGAVADSLGTASNSVRVEGHTDDVPIHTDRYRSNWELSTSRATNVVAFLVGAGVIPGRLSAAGYGEFHPRASNANDLDRSRNRRVDIVILNMQTTAREEPGQASGM
jgi:chemotaxis protein MotB